MPNPFPVLKENVPLICFVLNIPVSVWNSNLAYVIIRNQFPYYIMEHTVDGAAKNLQCNLIWEWKQKPDISAISFLV